MIANKINAEHMKKRGYSADSIAVNLGVTLSQLEQIERAPVPVLEWANSQIKGKNEH